MQQVQHKTVYRVTSFGVDVEWTDELKKAQEAYKDTHTAEMWKITGPIVQLVAKKRQYTPLDSFARYSA